MEFQRDIFHDASEQSEEQDGWRQRYWQTGRGAYKSSTEFLSLPGLGLIRERISVSVLQETESPAGRTTFIFPLAAENGWRVNSHHERDLVVAVRKGSTELTSAVGAASDLVAIGFDANLFPATVSRDGVYSFPRHGRDLHTLDWLTSLIALGATGFRLPGRDAEFLAQIIAERFIDLGLRLDGDTTKTLSSSSRVDVFRRAQAHVEAPQDEAITLHMLARRMDLPLADLYMSIRDSVGMRPADWLRAMRLAGARRDLLLGRGRTVAATAMTWGFFHLGRFSCGYHAHFGESPRATTRRRANRRVASTKETRA